MTAASAARAGALSAPTPGIRSIGSFGGAGQPLEHHAVGSTSQSAPSPDDQRDARAAR